MAYTVCTAVMLAVLFLSSLLSILFENTLFSAFTFGISALAVSTTALLVFRVKDAEINLIKNTKNYKSSLLLFPIALLSIAGLGALEELIAEKTGAVIRMPEPKNYLFSLCTSALFSAFCEEILCRYTLINVLISRGKGTAVTVSALCFSLMHLNFYQMPYAFVAGLFLGYIAVNSGSIIMPFALHAINNAISLSVYMYPDISKGVTLALVALSLVSLVVVCAEYIGEGRRVKVFDTKRFALCTKEAILSPLPIYFICAIIITILL